MGWMDFECGFDAGQVIGKKGWMMIVRCWDGFCGTDVQNSGVLGLDIAILSTGFLKLNISRLI